MQEGGFLQLAKHCRGKESKMKETSKFVGVVTPVGKVWCYPCESGMNHVKKKYEDYDNKDKYACSFVLCGACGLSNLKKHNDAQDLKKKTEREAAQKERKAAKDKAKADREEKKKKKAGKVGGG